MTNVMTTKMSSKGQIVLPEAMRNMLGWEAGMSFTLFYYNGAVIMQPIIAPTDEELANEFTEACAESRRQAKAAGLKLSDITSAIKSVRAARKIKI